MECLCVYVMFYINVCNCTYSYGHLKYFEMEPIPLSRGKIQEDMESNINVINHLYTQLKN